jgi:preprotein translocase subunit SecG
MLLYYAVITLHVIVCVILVLVVLLQSGRGADLAGAFGGGATQTAFGSRGPASFLSKMTTVAAIVFMLTSMGLGMISTKTEQKSVLETSKEATQPAKKAPAAQQPVLPALTPEQIKKKVEELQSGKAAGAKQSSGQTETSKPAETKQSGK